jgi:hypothetical protein
VGIPNVYRKISKFISRFTSVRGRPLVISALSLNGLLAVGVNRPGYYYIHWGFIQTSLANLMVIWLMIMVFVVGQSTCRPAG